MINFLEFLRKKYSEFSEFSGRKGTVVDELVVRPTGLVMSNFYNLQVEHQARNNILNWENMTEDQLDFYGNKFIMPRARGDKANGSIRVYLQYKKDFTITSDSRAVADDGLLYIFKNPGNVSKNSFYETGSTGYDKYYVDLMIEANTEGQNYNKNVGEITGLSNVDFEYVSVSNVKELEGGTLRENNEQYFNRLMYSINDRSMMNRQGVFALLPKYFPSIRSIYIVGPRNKYMKRDFVQAVDLSSPKREAQFLGKTQGDSIINNLAFWGKFPAEAGTQGASFTGPFSIYSDYNYPLTVEAIDLTDDDPAFHGYPLYQEATSDMYRGLYFDDLTTFMTVETEELFNIVNEDIGFSPIITPNSDWVIGANLAGNGDYGVLEEGLSKIDIVSFESDTIYLKGGSDSVITASKDINKRTGIKLSGTFKVPSLDTITSSLNSNIQFMVGGVDAIDETTGSRLADSFTGLGFGVHINSNINDDIASPTIDGYYNANVYFAHSERYKSGFVYANTTDSHISFDNMNALAVYAARLRPATEYTFEFVVNDNLVMSLVINKVEIEDNNDDQFTNKILPQTILNSFKDQINSIGTDRYGTMMKVTLDTNSTNNEDVWEVSGLKALDLAEHRANSLFIFDVKGLEDPLSIVYRGSGSGSVNGANSSGYSVYIWDTEKEPIREGTSLLSNGGWSELQNISDPGGIKDTVSYNLTQNLTNIDRYIVKTRYGSNIILLSTTTGSSDTKLLIDGDLSDDIKSILSIDYIKIESTPVDQFHADNKADLYVDTIKNTDNYKILDTTITKTNTESYFTLNTDNGFEMPIAEILLISNGSSIDDNNNIDVNDYKVIRGSASLINSSEETIKIVIEGTNEITVRYAVYGDIKNIQDFYDLNRHGKVYGNVLIKHKFFCYLDMNLSYTGDSDPEDLISAIRNYLDTEVDNIFQTKDMISYLYANKFINNIQEPVEIFYEKLNDELEVISGSFTDTLTIRNIDFFRLRNITASKL